MITIGLLVARVMIGLSLAAHGTQKLFGWFGGYGLNGTGGFFDKLGYKPGVMFAALAGLGETAGGILTALGLFGPVGPALIVLVMIVAAGTIHIPNGFFATTNGFELNAGYAAGAIALAFGGPGTLSLDSGFGLTGYFTGSVDASVVAAGVALGLITLTLRRKHDAGTGESPAKAGA